MCVASTIALVVLILLAAVGASFLAALCLCAILDRLEERTR